MATNDQNRKIRNAHAGAIAAIALTLLFLLGFLRYKSHFDVQTAEGWIHRYGYIAIPVVIFIGNLGVPVPEETVVLLGGFAAGRGDLSYAVVVLLCIATAIVGDSFGFLIGKKGGRPFVIKYGERVGITKERFERYERFFANYGARTVFVARFIAGLRFMAGPLAGASGLPFHRFFVANASGAVVWVLVMTQIGYRFGPGILHALSHAQLVAFVLAIIAFAFFIKRTTARV